MCQVILVAYEKLYNFSYVKIKCSVASNLKSVHHWGFHDKESKIIPVKQDIQKVKFSHLLKLEAHFLKIVADTVASIGISDTFWYTGASKSGWQSKSSFIVSIRKHSIELLNILNDDTKTQFASHFLMNSK